MTPEIKSMEELKDYLTREFPQFRWQNSSEGDSLLGGSSGYYYIYVTPLVFHQFQVKVVVNNTTYPLSVSRMGSNLKEVVAAVCERIQHEVNKLEGVIKALGG